MIQCKICNKEFNNYRGLGSHLCKHNITSQEYYDKYLKIDNNDGICKICGNKTNFTNINNGYHIYCCKACADSDIDKQQKTKETIIQRYGVNAYIEFGKIANSTKIERYGTVSYTNIEKRKQTNLEKYGVEEILQLPQIHEKSKQTKINKYKNATYNNQEKSKQTCLEKYGVNYSFQSDNNKEKAKQTCIEKYGVDNISKSEKNKQKIKNNCFEQYGVYAHTQRPEIRKKISNALINGGSNKAIETKKKNGTFNSSKYEKDFEQFLIDNNINYKTQYIDERYPFHCDFYLPDTDTFIEINGFWTHGKHWFNKNNQDDLNILNMWIEKSKSSNFYKLAIKVWTIMDIQKYNCAKNNKLNYITLWNKNDIEQFKKELEVKYGKKEKY